MAPKRAKFYTYGDEERCQGIREFIEEAGIIVAARDMKKVPLSVYELDRLIGYGNLTHFLNPLAASYKKNKLDQDLPDRDKVLELIADDNDLLRRPIIATIRLMTIGFDKKKISEMLQIGAFKVDTPPEAPSGNSGGRRGGSRGGHSNSRHRRRESAAGAGK